MVGAWDPTVAWCGSVDPDLPTFHPEQLPSDWTADLDSVGFHLPDLSVSGAFGEIHSYIVVDLHIVLDRS